MTESIWERITTALEEAGLPATQSAVARLCAIKQPSVHDWTQGSIPSRQNIIKIAIAAGVTTEWLETGRGQKHPDAPHGSNLEELLITLRSFDDDEIATVVDFAKYEASKRDPHRSKD